jgi:hypothetical protein
MSKSGHELFQSGMVFSAGGCALENKWRAAAECFKRLLPPSAGVFAQTIVFGDETTFFGIETDVLVPT